MWHLLKHIIQIAFPQGPKRFRLIPVMMGQDAQKSGSIY
jgi:hypothetical protein